MVRSDWGKRRHTKGYKRSNETGRKQKGATDEAHAGYRGGNGGRETAAKGLPLEEEGERRKRRKTAVEKN